MPARPVSVWHTGLGSDLELPLFSRPGTRRFAATVMVWHYELPPRPRASLRTEMDTSRSGDPGWLAARVAAAVGLMVSFYALALAIAGGLIYLAYLDVTVSDRVHGKVVVFCVLGGLSVLWAIIPRPDRFDPPGREAGSDQSTDERVTRRRRHADPPREVVPRDRADKRGEDNGDPRVLRVHDFADRVGHGRAHKEVGQEVEEC